MQRTDSTTELIIDDSAMGYINECSSGYESASGSDNEAHTEDSLTPTCDQFAIMDKIWEDQHQQATKEKMSYHNTQDLSSHLRYIMSMPELCDVTFLVGSKQIPVYGVKAIMGARSRVMYNLILKQQREREFQTKSRKKHTKSKHIAKTDHHLVIAVRKYQPDDFQKIVEYLHCGTVDISPANIAGLLCGASQFELDDLTRACWDFIKHCSRNGSICLLIPAARNYCHHPAGKTLISWILSATRKTTVV